MKARLPLLGLTVYGLSLAAFLVDLLAEVTGWSWLATLPWILHEVFTLLVLSGLIVGMFFIWQALRLTQQNERHLERQLHAASGAFQDGIASYFEHWGLSNAEKDVAILTIKGMSIAEIAEFRETKESTVKTQSSAIYKKAGVSSRTQLVSLLIEELL